jgi:hypothetical protein
MSLSLLITINVLADIALVAGLAYAMSRATRLRPHVASLRAAQPLVDQAPAQQHRARQTRSGRPQVGRARTSTGNRPGAHAAAAHE